jgi:hypothetical protein
MQCRYRRAGEPNKCLRININAGTAVTASTNIKNSVTIPSQNALRAADSYDGLSRTSAWSSRDPAGISMTVASQLPPKATRPRRQQRPDQAMLRQNRGQTPPRQRIRWPLPSPARRPKRRPLRPQASERIDCRSWTPFAKCAGSILSDAGQPLVAPAPVAAGGNPSRVRTRNWISDQRGRV